MLLLDERNIYLNILEIQIITKKKKYFYKFISYSVERNMDTRSEDYTYKDDITVLMIIYIAKLFIC